MKLLFQLALQNMLRARRRTILTFAVLAFGVAMYIWMSCLLKGFDDTSFKNLIDFDTGHFRIYSRNFNPDQPYILSNFILEPDSLLKKLESEKVVLAAAPRIRILAEADNYNEVLPVIVVGIDTVRDAEVYNLTDFLQEGGMEEGGIIIGENLARDFEVGVGDTLNITFRNKDEGVVSMEYLVSGIIQAPDPQFNNAAVILSLDELQRGLNIRGVSDIAVRTRDFNLFRQYQPAIQKILGPELKLENWYDLSRESVAISQMKSKFSNIFILFIIVIALVGIINTMLMSVYEKRREIGTLKALGMTDKEVQKLFVIEGMIIGFAGGVAGILLGILVNIPFLIWGIDITAMMGDMDMGWRVSGAVKSAWSLPAIVGSLFISVLASMAASYYPARKTTRMHPVECLRTVQ